MDRGSGILLHISSLPSKGGIGTIGETTCRFVDFLTMAGQRYWQVLPLNPPALGQSPYSSVSSAAGNPLLIDLDMLVDHGLLKQTEVEMIDWGARPDQVDFIKVSAGRDRLLRLAYQRFTDVAANGVPNAAEKEALIALNDAPGWEHFLAAEADWLDDYALYMALTEEFEGKHWPDWPEQALKQRRPAALAEAKSQLAEEIVYHQFVQYLFHLQWAALKDYAQKNGIQIIGDLPFYVPLESVEAWVHRELLSLDSEGNLLTVGGVPPDYYSKTGQIWNSPLYNWTAIREQNYDFWIRRVAWTAKFVDIIRLDHFRGFESYWSIPAGSPDGRTGEWLKGPGIELLHRLFEEFPQVEFIAEDLGMLTPEARQLVADSGLPGMKVLQFAFQDADCIANLPVNYPENSICYTGTHDNNTIRGFIEEKAGSEELARAAVYLHLDAAEGWNWSFIRACMESASKVAVFPIQDALDLPATARMNIPGTTKGNWAWRLTPGQLTPALAGRIRYYCELEKRGFHNGSEGS
ncbi:MAG TPA: 4-alpha-glucanotransferase [Clostridiales bacterium]|nr:4-alpha-glucanotransferase [Clostridiales bacterium]